jgi:hypothetical protein
MHRSGDLVNKMERVTWREAATVCQAIHLEPRSQSAVLRWEAAVQLSMNRTRINTNKVFRGKLCIYYGTSGQQLGASVQFVGVPWNMYDWSIYWLSASTIWELQQKPHVNLDVFWRLPANVPLFTYGNWFTFLAFISGWCPMIYDEPQESTSDHKYHKKKDGHPGTKHQRPAEVDPGRRATRGDLNMAILSSTAVQILGT